ncbi:Brp/Blh family beta-carotene 15,15'-dioxygenase [Haloarchaeobius iranensis]|uniref:Probable beta-carotene 15,15'-dioxygenase n=1 Tax=Haloarchaeobius iranensis TaxID=996166 RepID=A0A1G9SNU5_9EURY|nr:Brp/Blh family beta-carotene 15,15'-dioxygenase [Haloarchaeobius iranensis]SDM37037.1 beta-carotene 15,15'-monooxygenase, Brp/Blh family [Haloarchaeobius iranensis]
MAVSGTAVRKRTVEVLFAPVWLVLAAVAAAFALGAQVSPTLAAVPLVASVLVLGLPHGATDHVVAAHSGLSQRAYLFVAAVYLVLGGAYLVAWFLAPVASFVFFIALTLVHWGQGDCYVLSERSDGRYPASRGHTALLVATRGALPMLVPLVAFPGIYERVFAWTVGLFGVGPDAVAWAFTPAARTVVAGALAVLFATTLAVGYRVDGETWRLDAAETGLLVAFFGLVPPLLAVGLYFTLWHSLRHVVRTVLLDEPSVDALARGDRLTAALRYVRDAAPNTVGALAVLAAVWVTVPRTPAGVEGAVAAYLVLLAVLTLPHFLVVSALDRAQGVWSAGET